MASQSDILNMAAVVTDGFSNPLKEMVKQLKSFGDYEKVVHKEGAKFVVQHRNAFEDLRKSMKGGAEQVKNVLTPAMVGLGLGAIGAASAIEGISRAIKEFAGTSRDIDQLNRATGISINNIRAMEALSERLGSTAGAGAAGMEKFAASFEQFHKFNRGDLTQLYSMDQHGEGARFANSIKGMADSNQVLIASLKELDNINTVAGKKRFLNIMGLDPALAYETKDQIEDIKKQIGTLTDEQLKAGLKGQEAFDRLRESVTKLKEEIGSGLAPVLTQITDSVREFVATHGEQMRAIMVRIADAIRDFDWAGFGQQIKSIVDSFGGWATALKLIVGIGIAAWLAPIALGFGALALSIGSATAASLAFTATPLGLALIAGAAGYEFLKNTAGKPLGRPEDIYKPGEGKLTSHQLAGLSTLGGGAGLNLKDMKDATKTGVFEGVIQAFQNWWNGPGAGDGAGGGGGGGGGGDTAPGHGRRALMGREGTVTSDRGSTPGTFKEKAPGVMKKLMDKYNLTKEQAAGIVGNLGEESGGFTQYHEGGKSEGTGGVGWAQWTGPRRKAFEAWTTSHGLDPRSDEASYRYLTEGDPQTAAAIAAVKQQSTVGGSMKAFEQSFENAGVKAYGVRERYAEEALRLGPGGGASPVVAPGGGYAGEAGLGQPGTAHGQKLVEVSDKFGHKFVTNEKFAGKFTSFLNELQGSGYKIHSLGGYEDRENANAAGKISKHALGMAVDVNADENPNQRDLKTDMPKGVAEMAAKYGLVWGGGFKGMKDPMHFEVGGGMPSHTGAPWKGLDRQARQHDSMNHTVSGRAGVDIKLAGFPKGTQIATRSDGIFKEVKLVRGRTYQDARDVG